MTSKRGVKKEKKYASQTEGTKCTDFHSTGLEQGRKRGGRGPAHGGGGFLVSRTNKKQKKHNCGGDWGHTNIKNGGKKESWHVNLSDPLK